MGNWDEYNLSHNQHHPVGANLQLNLNLPSPTQYTQHPQGFIFSWPSYKLLLPNTYLCQSLFFFHYLNHSPHITNPFLIEHKEKRKILPPHLDLDLRNDVVIMLNTHNHRVLGTMMLGGMEWKSVRAAWKRGNVLDHISQSFIYFRSFTCPQIIPLL